MDWDGPAIVKVLCPFIEATLTYGPFPTTSRHLGGSHPCITVFLIQRLNVEVVPEVGCCKCGISKAHARLSEGNNTALCVGPQVSILILKGISQVDRRWGDLQENTQDTSRTACYQKINKSSSYKTKCALLQHLKTATLHQIWYRRRYYQVPEMESNILCSCCDRLNLSVFLTCITDSIGPATDVKIRAYCNE